MAGMAANMMLNVTDIGAGDQLAQQLQDELALRRKTGTAAKNPLSMGDMTQQALGMAASMLGFGSPGGPGGPLAKSIGEG